MDRKNYFYPDLPKAYQISQLYRPLCQNGYIEIDTNEGIKRIGIKEIHMEEDAGKLVHDEHDGRFSFVDYNRCGVPLIEIVTNPDFRTAEEVKTFLEKLKAILQFAGVSDCKMQEGSLRVDVNVSVRPKSETELGTRTEIKNLNSFKAIIRAIDSEAKRQIQIIKSGGKVMQETRRWDDTKGASYGMRSKEEAHDYRYFPEPDLVPVVVDQSRLDEIKASMPEMPDARKKRYITEYGLPEYDAWMLTSSKALSDFFESAVKESINHKTVSVIKVADDCKDTDNVSSMSNCKGMDNDGGMNSCKDTDYGGNTNIYKSISNWIMGDLIRILKEKNMEPEEIPFSGRDLAKMVQLIDTGRITGTIAKKVFELMFETGKDPEAIIKEENLEVLSDTDELMSVIKSVIESNVKSVEDYKAGKNKAMGFLVGQVMKKTGGKADPKLVNKLLAEELSKA